MCNSSRLSWDAYFLQIAKVVASRSTCDRKHVGSVIVKDRQILSTGYNGSMPGDEHCCDSGCLVVEGHCIRTSHAELNAVSQAAKHGVCIGGGTLYVTMFPCWTCFKAVINAGIKRIVFSEEYEHTTDRDLVFSSAGRLGIEIVESRC